jgi:hypothetical protein
VIAEICGDVVAAGPLLRDAGSVTVFLWEDQQDRTAERLGEGGRQQPELGAEIGAEIGVFDNVTRRVDRDHRQQQPRRAENARVAAVEVDDRAKDTQPDGNDDPVNQGCQQSHIGSLSARRNVA